MSERKILLSFLAGDEPDLADFISRIPEPRAVGSCGVHFEYEDAESGSTWMSGKTRQHRVDVHMTYIVDEETFGKLMGSPFVTGVRQPAEDSHSEVKG